MKARAILVVAVLAVAVGAGWTILARPEPTRPPDVVDFAPRITETAVPDESECDLVLSAADKVLDGDMVEPGQVVCLEAGSRGPLEIHGVRGEPDSPVVVINHGGRVEITGSPDDYAGINVTDSENIRISGSGEVADCGAGLAIGSQQCGITIGGTGRGVAGTEKTTGITIDHIEVYDTRKSGLFIASNADEGAERGEWVQKNTVIYNVYVHDTGTEGLYIGSSDYDGGEDPVLEGVSIRGVLAVKTGWDGIQVGSAVDGCVIEGNRVLRPATENEDDQRAGIINNRGSSCDILSNVIADAMSDGIYLHGNGGNLVANNLIIRPGDHEELGDGIVVATGSNQGRGVQVVFNTVISPSGRGIKYSNQAGGAGSIEANLIVEPAWPAPDPDRGITLDDATDVRLAFNLILGSLEDAGFVSTESDDFRLTADSPAIDFAADLGTSLFDFDGRPRVTPDAGAFEYLS